MTKKSWTYTVVGVLALVLGYFNYFGENKKLDTLKKVIETTNAIYKSADYFVEAKKQIDYVDDKETKFEIAKAIVKGMTLSGDNVMIDKLRNLILKNNIVGKSTNGWTFNTSELHYNKETDEIFSDTLVSATNEEKGVHLEGNRFVTTTSMSHILLENGVKFEVKQAGLSGDKAEYSDETKNIVLTGNVSLYNPDKNGKGFQGNFEDMLYNVSTGKGETHLPFDIKYQDTFLRAEDLAFYPEKNSFHIEKNVHIQKEDYEADLMAVDKKEGEEIIHFIGPIQGKSLEYTYSLQNADYDSNKKEILLTGNIHIVSKKGEVIRADRALYHETDKTLDVYGDANDASYEGNGHKIEGKAFHYDTKTGNITTNSPYRYTNKEGDIFEGKNLTYDKAKEEATILGEVLYQSKDYTLKTVDLKYSKEIGILDIKNPYVLTMKDGSTFEGKSATYNEKTGELNAPGNVVMRGKDQVTRGHDVKYNNKTGKGSMEGPVTMVSEVQKMNLTGERLVFEKEKGAELLGNIHGNLQGTIVDTNRAIYQKDSETIVLPNSIAYRNPEQNLQGTMQNGDYFLKEHKFEGKQFVALRPGEKVTSDYAEYFTDTKKVSLVGNVRMENKDQVVTTEKADYDLPAKVADIPEDFTMTKGTYKTTGREAHVDFTKQTVFAKKPYMTSGTGDEFKSEILEGNLETMIFDFKDNVYGKTLQKNVKSEYRGEKAKVYLAKVGGKYQAKKVEVFEDAVFTQEDKKLTGDHGEYTFDNHLVTFLGNVIFTSKDGKISANEMIYNTETKKAKAKGNVKMNYDDGKKE